MCGSKNLQSLQAGSAIWFFLLGGWALGGVGLSVAFRTKPNHVKRVVIAVVMMALNSSPTVRSYSFCITQTASSGSNKSPGLKRLPHGSTRRLFGWIGFDLLPPTLTGTSAFCDVARGINGRAVAPRLIVLLFTSTTSRVARRGVEGFRRKEPLAVMAGFHFEAASMAALTQSPGPGQ